MTKNAYGQSTADVHALENRRYGTWIFSLARTTTRLLNVPVPAVIKKINRTNLSAAQIEELMKTDIVKEQLKLLHFRNVSKAFGFDADLAVSTEGETITFTWTNQGESATLRANLKTFEYEITDSGESTHKGIRQ